MRAGVASVLVFATAACTSTVAGEGRLAAEVYVPPTVTTTAPAPGPTATPTAKPTPTARRTPSTTPKPAPPAIPPAFSGTWRGRISQPRSVITSWTAVLALPAGQARGTFQVLGYCTGTALLVTASATRLVLLEVITSDPSGRCAGSGTIVLTPAGGSRLRMSWTDSAVRTNTGTGILSRG